MIRNIQFDSPNSRGAAIAANGRAMSEGYTVEDTQGETIGIVVRKESGRGFRFFSSTRAFDALDGHIFASAEAAQRAARDIEGVGKRGWRTITGTVERRMGAVT
jgi:hypothetical protein